MDSLQTRANRVHRDLRRDRGDTTEFFIAVHVLPTQASDLPKDNALASERCERAPTRLHHPYSPLLCSVGKITVDVHWFSIDNATSRLGFFLVQLVRVNWLFCNLP